MIPARRTAAGAGLKKLIDAVGDVVFPRSCVHCLALVEADAGRFRCLCRRCVAAVDYVRPPHCTTCGQVQ